MNSRLQHIPLTVVIVVLMSACVTTKKSKSETGWLKTKIHDMNARYNGWFNANELYKASINQLMDGHVDNYNHVLEIYPYGTEDDRKSVEANMDKAIEKVVKVAALHEPSKWVDDCYVMMGKAQYLKGDYESAQETLEYFVDDFNPTDPDSRVYKSPDRKTSTRDRKKKQAEERKIQKEERKKVKEEKEKTRKQEAKERKKARKQAEKDRKQRNKDRKKGKKTTKPTPVVAAEEEVTEEAPVATATASTNSEVPIDPDEAYIRDLEANQERSKEKKIEKGQNGGFLKHKPAYYEGMFWLARTLIAREKWIEANYFLDKLETDDNVLKKVKAEVPVVRADYYLQQKDYRNAINALVIALENTSDRRLKARMSFILAQAYQMNGQAAEAKEAFDKVKKYKTNFEMELNAELNQLKNAWAAGSLSNDQVTKKLNRMAKQDRNRNYLGGIYSTIAEIKIVDGDQAGAMEYFQLALENSSNNAIKSEIYYRLGTLFFANEKYLQAKNYYDSTLVVMSEKDERFNPTKNIVTSLKDIAKNIETINTQDSLLRLGAMSDADLKALAKKQAEEKWEKTNKKEEEPTSGFTATTSVFSGNSKFFAYNQVSKQRGRQDFLRRWGERPLEDDWRRSNKSSSVFDQEEFELLEEPDAMPTKELNKEIEKILRGVPRKEAERLSATKQIEKAMFELGTGFRTNINNYAKSNETLLGLIERFPGTEHMPEAMYFIHLNFIDLNKGDMAESFKTRLIREFPESPFSKYLKNPSDDTALITEEKTISLFYNETYKLFEKGAYSEAASRLRTAKEQFGDSHHMSAKYNLLSALCVGNLEGQDEYINALRSVILRYDGTPEQTYAREMLRFLRGDKESFEGEVSEEELAKYVVEDKKLHYVLAVVQHR